jgi:hypothetical protein
LHADAFQREHGVEAGDGGERPAVIGAAIEMDRRFGLMNFDDLADASNILQIEALAVTLAPAPKF